MKQPLGRDVADVCRLFPNRNVSDSGSLNREIIS